MHIIITDNEESICFVRSQKGKIQMVKDGYFYCQEKTINNKIYWRCAQYTTTSKCHARLHTLKGEIVRKTPHNHEIDKAKLRKTTNYR